MGFLKWARRALFGAATVGALAGQPQQVEAQTGRSPGDRVALRAEQLNAIDQLIEHTNAFLRTIDSVQVHREMPANIDLPREHVRTILQAAQTIKDLSANRDINSVAATGLYIEAMAKLVMDWADKTENSWRLVVDGWRGEETEQWNALRITYSYNVEHLGEATAIIVRISTRE